MNSPSAPQPITPAAPQGTGAAPQPQGLPSVIHQVARNLLSPLAAPLQAVNDVASNAFGQTMHVQGGGAAPVPAQQAPAQEFLAKFKNPSPAVLGIEPAINRASKAFGVSPDALYYTLVSENAPGDANPKGVDPNDQGMFQVNKLNSPLVETTLNKEFGIKYDSSNPQHSAMAAAVVLSDTAKQLQSHGYKNLSPQDLSVAYRMGPTNYSIATRGTDLNGNKARPLQKEAIQKEYRDRVADLNSNNHSQSTTGGDIATAQ